MTAPAYTDANWAAWLAKDSEPRCVLVELDYRNSGGTTVTAYLSTSAYVSEPSDTPANQVYSAVVRSIPQFSQRMSDVLVGATTPQYGNIVIDNGDGAFDSWLTLNFSGRAARVYLGAANWPKAAFRAVWIGVIATMQVGDVNTFVVQIRSRQHLMNQNVESTVFASGAPMPSTTAGKYYPLCYGDCRNVSPILIDASYLGSYGRYRVNAAACYAIDEVRSKGVAVAFTDGADGTFYITGTNDGEITCDVRGMKSGANLIDDIKEIITDICITRGPFQTADFDTATWTNLATTFPQKLGLYVAQPVPIYQLLDQLCASVGAFYYVTRDGLINIKQFALSGASTLDIGVNQIAARGLSVTKVYQPIDKLRRGYLRQWTVQQYTAAGASLDDREVWLNAYAYKVSTNAAATNITKTAEPEIEGTLLTSGTDCQTEADRWMTIWGSVRVQFQVKCFTDGARVNLGDRVTLTHPRYGLEDGVTGTVVAVTDQPSKHAQLLEILT